MNIDEAINKAADHIEQHPDRYDFTQGMVMPGYQACIYQACMLARIGEMAGMPALTGHDRVAYEVLGISANEFYHQIAQASRTRNDPCRDTKSIPQAMRTVAKHYAGIPLSVRQLFEEPSVVRNTARRYLLVDSVPF